jgi:hypothetical protein
VAQIVCLANSYKTGGRCIAGIDIKTGEWVRPIPNNINKAITTQRFINCAEPKILDILEIPLENDGPDEGCQPENRLLKRGRWTKIGELKPRDLLRYCTNESVVLHNDEDRVPPDLFLRLPKEKWRSLQLVHDTNVCFYCDPWRKWHVSFRYGHGKTMDLKLTDPVILQKLESGQKVIKECILTVSLATPFSRSPADPKFCWKMVAGVVEL